MAPLSPIILIVIVIVIVFVIVIVVVIGIVLVVVVVVHVVVAVIAAFFRALSREFWHKEKLCIMTLDANKALSQLGCEQETAFLMSLAYKI